MISSMHKVRRLYVKRMHKWGFFLWIFPGVPVTVFCLWTRNYWLLLAWTLLMSQYTIIVEHLIGWLGIEES